MTRRKLRQGVVPSLHLPPLRSSIDSSEVILPERLD